ncbi:hypothetical protein EYF80_049911 [Liparis tanakae]|uniref:Uncharacterized protein n=1 Tax=Liparis tanakae TaxID=230148 RepID=A0A4Z2FHZ5_9TELE|nr:hypothetical protein EYF80_049911 [Liparis tanakae]
MILAESRICTALSSSRMFPSEDCSVSRILSSISFSCFLLAADCRMRAVLSPSRSGLRGGDEVGSSDGSSSSPTFSSSSGFPN